MKKTLLKLISLIVALGVAAFLVTREEAPPAPKTLVIEGYASAEELAAEKTRGILDGPADIAYPIDEIVIARQGETIRLVRKGEGKELNWTLEAPMKASAVKFRVEKIVKLFKARTTSVHTKGIKPEDLPLFDFEPERRVRVTLKANGAIWQGVDLIIGRVEESESQAAQSGVAKDTWVMQADDETRAYRIGGKDLRSECMTALSDLRDKRLFTVEANDVVEVKVTNPEGQRLMLKGKREEVASANAATPTSAKVTWSLTEPTGYTLDESVTSFIRNITNARTKAFVPGAEGPQGGLGTSVWHIEAKTYQGEAFGLRFASEGDPAWAQVDGQDEWVQIETYTLKNLQKSLADLRDKSLWSLKEGDIDSVTFGATDGNGVRVTRKGNLWVMDQRGPADMSTHLRQLASVKAKRYATPAEIEEANAALKRPSFVSEIRAGEVAYALKVSNELEGDSLKNHHWAQVNNGAPVLIAGFNAQRFLKDADALALKRFFSFDKNAIESLSVTHPDKTLVALKRRGQGQALELIELPEGKSTTKAPAVGTMAGTLPNLKAKTFEPQTRPADAGLNADESYRVSVQDTSGDTHVFLISTKRSGPDPYVMALTGPLAKRVATISNFQALNLQKKATELSD